MHGMMSLTHVNDDTEAKMGPQNVGEVLSRKTWQFAVNLLENRFRQFHGRGNFLWAD